MNSMLTAMRSGISAVGRRMGVNLPLPLRKMLEGWPSALLAITCCNVSAATWSRHLEPL